MESFLDYYKLLNNIFINGLPFGVFILIVSKTFFKNLETTKTSKWISWLILGFTVIYLIGSLQLVVFDRETLSTVISKATGTYSWAFWIMTIGHLFLPLLLLKKSYRTKLIPVFLVALTMNIGWLMESFIIHITSLHREYYEGSIGLLPTNNELLRICSGIVICLILLTIENLRKKPSEQVRGI